MHRHNDERGGLMYTDHMFRDEEGAYFLETLDRLVFCVWNFRSDVEGFSGREPAASGGGTSHSQLGAG